MAPPQLLCEHGAVTGRIADQLFRFSHRLTSVSLACLHKGGIDQVPHGAHQGVVVGQGRHQPYVAGLSQGNAVAGVAVPLAPTLGELRSAGFLNAGFPERTPFNQLAAVRIEKGGTCPGTACRLDALVYTTTPLRASGASEPSTDLMAQVREALGVDSK